MTKAQDRQVYLDVAKDMGMLGVVASHCLVETSLSILSDWHGFFMLAVFYVYTGWRYALRYGKERTGISSREMTGKRFISLGISYVCYSVLLIFSRTFLVWSQQYIFLVLMSGIYYTGTLMGLETLWFLPSMFITELLFNTIYGSCRKMGTAVCLVGAASVCPILYINGSRQDTTLWRVIHLPIMVYIKGLVGLLLALGGIFVCDVWQKASMYLKGRAGSVAAFLLMCLGVVLAVLIPGCNFNSLVMENLISRTLTAWLSSVTTLILGERVSACGGSWKERWIFSRVLVPFFIHYGTHSLIVMCTHLAPVVAFSKVAAGRVIYLGVLGSTSWDTLLFVLVLAVDPGVVRLIETWLPWMDGRKERSK